MAEVSTVDALSVAVNGSRSRRHSNSGWNMEGRAAELASMIDGERVSRVLLLLLLFLLLLPLLPICQFPTLL